MRHHRLETGFTTRVEYRRSSPIGGQIHLVESFRDRRTEPRAQELKRRDPSRHLGGIGQPARRLSAKCLSMPSWGRASMRMHRRHPYLVSLLVLGLLFVSSISSALDQIYYVDNTSGGPSLGTEADPFLTIQEATDQIGTRDTIIVIGATEASPRLYPERVNFLITAAGVSGVTVTASPRRSVLTYGFWTRRAGDGLTIEGFQMTIPDSVYNDLGAQHGVDIDSDSVVVHDNYIYDTPRNGIFVTFANPYHSDGRITQNHLYRCGAGITIFGDNWLIEGNEVDRLVYHSAAGGDADYSRAFGSNITFRYNYFHGVLLSEIGPSHVDGFQTFALNGLELHGLVFDNNIVLDYGQGFYLEGVDGPGRISDITVRNNIFDGGNYGAAFGVSLSWVIPNIVVTHNVIANSVHGVFLANGATATVQNNIFYDAGTNLNGYTGFTVTGGYNLFTTEGWNDQLVSTDVAYVDPLFVNPDNWVGPDGIPFTADDGVRLLLGSPAIDAGTNAGTTQDIFGTSRPQDGLFDIGPHEFLSGAPPPPPEVNNGGGGGCGAVIWTDGTPPPGSDFMLILLVALPFLRQGWHWLQHRRPRALNQV